MPNRGKAYLLRVHFVVDELYGFTRYGQVRADQQSRIRGRDLGLFPVLCLPSFS